MIKYKVGHIVTIADEYFVDSIGGSFLFKINKIDKNRVWLENIYYEQKQEKLTVISNIKPYWLQLNERLFIEGHTRSKLVDSIYWIFGAECYVVILSGETFLLSDIVNKKINFV